MTKLYIISGPMGGTSTELKDGATFIGKASDNDIQIKDRSISRKHVKIIKKDEILLIEDLKSENGTWIDEDPIKPGYEFEVEEGLPVSIGDTVISLGRECPRDRANTKYSINLSEKLNGRKKNLSYRERRITNKRELELIYEVSSALMQSLDINEISQKIMDSLFDRFRRIDGGAILLIDDTTGKLKEIITRSRDKRRKNKNSYSRTIVDRVIRDGKAVMISDTSQEDEENLSDSIVKLKIKSIMCVPLISKSQTRGVIYVHSVRVPDGFRKDDLFLLTGLSYPAAVSLENALLYSKSKRAEEALQTARDELEERVGERTAELSDANALLQQEISERKRAEEELQETNKFLKNILDSSSSISIISTDLDSNVLFWNKGAENIFGYKAEEIVGRQKIDILYPDDETKEGIQKIKSSVFSDNKELTFEIREATKDGRELWIHSTLTPRLDENGQIVGILGIGNDITKRKQAEKEKEKLEGQLQHAQKMEAVGTLAGGIAHDFNNLLMGIQGNASLMLLDVDPSHPHYEKLRNIEQYIQNAAGLTKQLLGFSKGGKYEVKPVSLNELIEKTSEMFGRTKKEISIHLKFQEDIWIVEADQGQIEQVLLNLYVNAWQAMPNGGDLDLETENVMLDQVFVKPYGIEPGNYVKISVNDTGVGMDNATKQRIFDPFFTTKKMGRGTGLGLASAYGIIKNHGGIIKVDSNKGDGATFNIYLPRSQKELIKEIQVAEKFLKGEETILLVDDEDMIIDVGKAMLRTLGYNFFVAKSGKEAVEIYKQKQDKIDMVILDMIMPDMGGQETYDHMHGINPDVKVLLSSGYSINDQTKDLLVNGCNVFIQKPFNIKQMSVKIREVLDKG
ncbi:MAG: PAS domain S-box protein [Desulfobacteraceae bacterium]|nr:MAG: PAS domain S-box protein [Desulfobacteraceae bacterium]